MSAARLLKHLKESGIRPGKSLARVALVGALMSVVTAAADNRQQEPGQKNPPDVAAQSSHNNGGADQLRKRVQQLTAELTRIKKRVAELEKDRQVDSIQDKLEKEQQRAEILQCATAGDRGKGSGLASPRGPI